MRLVLQCVVPLRNTSLPQRLSSTRFLVYTQHISRLSRSRQNPYVGHGLLEAGARRPSRFCPDLGCDLYEPGYAGDEAAHFGVLTQLVPGAS